MTEYDPEQAPLSPGFAAWARFVLRFRWALLVASVAGTGFFAHQAAVNRQVDTSVEAFLSTDSEAFAVLEQMRDDFGRDEMLLVLVEGDVFSMPFLQRLQTLHEELAAIDVPITTLGQRKSERDEQREARQLDRPMKPATRATHTQTEAASDIGGFAGSDDFGDFGDFGDEGWGDEAGGSVVDEITSLINVRQTRWKGGGLHVGGLLDEWPDAEQLPALKERVLQEPTLVGRVVDDTGRYAAVLLRLHFMSEDDTGRVYNAVLDVAERHQGDGFHVQVAGMPALSSALNQLMLSDLGRMGAAGVVLMVLIMSVVFRHPMGVIGPLFVVAQSVLWMLGSMAFAGVPMTMITNILPAFVVVVGIGDSVHIQSVYRDAFARLGDTRAAIVHAVGTTGVPVLFTTMTTAVGLLSFRFARVDAIQDMGTFGALGVLLALMHSLIFLPIVLSFNKRSLLGLRRRKDDAADLIDRALGFCNELSRPSAGAAPERRRRLMLLTAAAVAVLSIAAAGTFRVYHDPLAWIPDGFSIKDAFTTADEHLGGTADLVLMVEAKPGQSLRDRELMLGLEQLEGHVRAYRHPSEGEVVSNVVSVLDVVRESTRAVHEGDQAHYGVPDTERGVTDLMTLFENAAPDELRRLATIDLQKALMIARVEWMDASSYRPLAAHLERGVDKYVGDKANVHATGSVLNLLTVVDGLLTDLMRSFGLAFVVITLMMILLLRDLKLGLIAMVPNLLPVIAVLGIMAAAGVPIDLSNILIASIAIGIAVDDTIHFLHQFRAHMARHGDVEAALSHAFSHAGRAMITTSIILVSGFMVFNAANMYNIQRFGMLVALSLGLALLVDLMFAPALLRTFYGRAPSQPRSQSAPPPPSSNSSPNTETDDVQTSPATS